MIEKEFCRALLHFCNSTIQNSKFVIQNSPACGSAALGSSAANLYFNPDFIRVYPRLNLLHGYGLRLLESPFTICHLPFTIYSLIDTLGG